MSDKYYYLTSKDIIREGDEEYIYDEDLERWSWCEVTTLSIGEHFQRGLDIRIRRARNIITSGDLKP